MDSMSLLTNLSDSDQKWMFDNMVQNMYRQDDVIIQTGQKNNRLILIEVGTVGVSLGNSFDNQVATLGPGRLAGELSFLNRHSVADATLIALEKTSVLELPFDLIEEKISEDPAFGRNFYKALALFIANKLSKANESIF